MMTRGLTLAVLFVALAGGCVDDAGVADLGNHFACDDDDDCLPGWVCGPPGAAERWCAPAASSADSVSDAGRDSDTGGAGSPDLSRSPDAASRRCGDGERDPGEVCDGGPDVARPPDLGRDVLGAPDVPLARDASGGEVDCDDDIECSVADCLFCADGVCRSRCDAEACEGCDGWGSCRSTCDAGACEVCDNGACSNACDLAVCEVCDGGDCRSRCAPETEVCDGGTCRQRAVASCHEPAMGAFCAASVVSAIELPLPADAATGEPGCCCDLTGDGAFDNAFADLMDNVGDMAGMDRAAFNESLAATLADGTHITVLEYIGLRDGGADTPAFDLASYAAVDDDGDPDNNLEGHGTFRVPSTSLYPNGAPIYGFDSASVAGGRLTAEGGWWALPTSCQTTGFDFDISAEDVSVTATIQAEVGGYLQRRGELCGYIAKVSVLGALNDYVATYCGCLGLARPLIVNEGGGSYACSEAAPTCDPEDEIGSICSTLNQFCGSVVLLLPMFLDVDYDGDEIGDAMSVGLRFSAVPASIVGVDRR